MLYGLLAAIGWGTATTTAALALRHARSHIVVLLSQAAGVAMLLALTVGTHARLLSLTGSVAVGLVLAGVFGLIAYLSFYQAVAYGSPGLISAISSTYGGVSAVLAVLLLGERLTALGTAGVALAVVGIALAAARPAEPRPATGPGGPAAASQHAPTPRRVTNSTLAVLLALVSALGYGVGGYLVGEYSRSAGWLLPAVIAHGTSVLVLASVLALVPGGRRWRRLTWSTAAWIVLAGLTDAGGLIAYARGTEIGQVAVTAAISSVYPIIPLAFGVLLLGERVSRRQLLGIVIIIAGLVLLGLA